MSLRATGVVFTLLACSQVSAAQYIEVPLVVTSSALSLAPEECGYAPALALSTGFNVRPPRHSESSWRADLSLKGSVARILLRDPAGQTIANRLVSVGPDPCATIIEVISILLAAHVPVLSTPEKPSDAPTTPPRTPPAPIETEPSDDSTPWNLRAGGSIGLNDSDPQHAAFADGRLQIDRWLVGLQLHFGLAGDSLDAGSARLVAFSLRLLLGLVLYDSDPLSLNVTFITGGRVSHAWSSGLQTEGSSTVVSAEVGPALEISWQLSTAINLNIGVAAVSLLPRPVFEITGAGRIFGTPALLGELWLGLSLEP